MNKQEAIEKIKKQSTREEAKKYPRFRWVALEEL